MTTNEQIIEVKKELGNRIVIPAHHYEYPEIVELSDFVGDSYKLAVDCSKVDAEFIIFCGVYFMAEAADILSSEDQKVIMPDRTAGCPMADQINQAQAEKALQVISQKSSREIIPVVYMNSYAEIKSFCGSRDGAVCTSSNAASVVDHYLQQDKAVFFAPDFNLGINTARKLGLKNEEIVRVNRDFNLSDYDAEKARFYIWDGFCHVHKEFTVQDIIKLKAKYKDIRIIVHPECDEAVVNNSHDSGSTQKIYNEIKKSAAGSIWGVGTEYHFVQRIAWEFEDKTVLPLRKSICHNMAKITPDKLLKSLESVLLYLEDNSSLAGLVQVDEQVKFNASKALNKMIKIVENQA